MARKKNLMPGVDVPVGGNIGGVYGEMQALTNATAAMQSKKRQQPTQPTFTSPYETTKTGIELLNSGQTAESIQTRTTQYQEEIDRLAKKKAATDATAATGLTGGAASGGTGGTATNKTSAFAKLKDRLNARGLGSLYDSVVGLIQEDLPDEEFTLRLRETPAYQTRFKSNAKRIAKGLTPLSEGAYLALEDAYQNIMRVRGLPESYYTKGTLGEQAGFETLIEYDVSPEELSGRIDLAQEVLDVTPGAVAQIKAYYPEISNGDLLSYVLNPKDAMKTINARLRSAQIGAEAAAAGLTGVTPEQIRAFQSTAESLQKSGTTQAQARQGFGMIAAGLPTAQKLSSIYGGDGYTQQEAQQEVFGLAGAQEAAKKRRRLASQERAQFEQQQGFAAGALERGRAGAI